MTFLMELENYSFQESIRILADRGGIEVPDLGNSSPSISEENQSILSAYEWLTKLYHHLLKYAKDGEEGSDYLKQRGINEDSINTFQLGYAPNVKGFTAEFLAKKGFHQQVLIKAGLLNLQEDGQVTDRFNGRAIFPIRNHQGKTIAFGGRLISGQGPKYLNSSESELFQKGKILYNFDLARTHIRKKSEVILFEGYTDVISAHQIGVENVTATLGTSLTETQARLLKRYVDTVIICYDADQAGIEASYQAALLLRSIGSQVKIVDLNNNMDPDGYIKEHGADAFINKIKASDTFATFYMGYLKKDFNLTIEGDRIQYIKKVIEQLATIENVVEREYYLSDLSKEFNLSIGTLADEVSAQRQKTGINKNKRDKNRYTNKSKRFYQAKKLLPAYHNAERQLIAYMLQDRAITDRVQREIEVDFHIEAHKIIVTHLYAFYEDGQMPDVSLFIERLTDEEIKQLVIELAMIPLLENSDGIEVSDYIRLIRTQTNDMVNINVFREQQRLAEQQNDPIKAAQIAMQIIEIKKQLKQSK